MLSLFQYKTFLEKYFTYFTMFVSQSNNWSTVKYFQSKESSRENLIKCFTVQTKAKHFPKFSHNYPPPPSLSFDNVLSLSTTLHLSHSQVLSPTSKPSNHSSPAINSIIDATYNRLHIHHG